MQHITNIQKNTFTALAIAALLVVGFVASTAQAATYTPSYSTTYTPSSTGSSGGSGSTYTPSYSTTYTPSTSSNGGAHSGGCCGSTGSTYTPSYSTTYTPSKPSTYTPSYSTTYTPVYSTPPTYTTTTYVTTGGGCNSNCAPVYTYTPTCTITAPDMVTAGQSFNVSWNSNYATIGNISNLGTNLAPSGTHTTAIGQTTTFVGTFNGNGKTGTCSKTVVVQQLQAPTCSISAPATVNAGQNFTVSWSSNNATAGNISNVGTYLPVNGSHDVSISQTTTFVGTFTGQGGTGTCSQTVTVNQVQWCPAGYTGTYPNCYPPVTNAPTCSITVNYNNSNNYYTPNQPVTINWTSNNAQYGFINNGMGSVPVSGSRTIYPTQNTTYTGTFTGYNGQSVTCAVTINSNTYVPPVYPNTPYVTLSAVPYTGLELGPVGTVVYWGFIAFWCLLAAYLIAVKRVQNHVYASLKGILFGKTEAAHAAPTAVHQNHVSYTTPVVRNEDLVDDFVLSQVHRARA